MIAHSLNKNELEEFKHILELLKSSDKESQELGIGLLKNYPEKAKAKYRYFSSCEYSFTLGHILLKYELKVITIDYIIKFVINILLYQHYYIDG